jgi:hypothetical protein
MRMRKRSKQASLGFLILVLYVGMLLTIGLVGYKIVYYPEPDLSLCPLCNRSVEE